MTTPDPHPARPRPSLVARGLSSVVGGYQAVRAGRPSPCRFTPSCSAYARDALETHGAARGLWLTARRVARCHPWGGHGWDPVPPRRDRATASSSSSASERKVA